MKRLAHYGFGLLAAASTLATAVSVAWAQAPSGPPPRVVPPSVTQPAPPVPQPAPTPGPAVPPQPAGPQIQITSPGGSRDVSPRPAPGADPTVPGPEIRQLLDGGAGQRNAVRPSEAIPDMKLKARILSRNRPAAAVIDIGGRSVTVNEGTEFAVSVPGGGDGAVVMRIIEVSAEAVRIEIENRSQPISLF